MTLPATLRTLRYRNVRLFFSGQGIPLIGPWMQNVAQAWLVYRLTGSSVLLMAPMGGIVADRLRRHRVVIATQTASMLLAFTLSVLTVTGAVRIWPIFVLAALLGGATRSISRPGRRSSWTW